MGKNAIGLQSNTQSGANIMQSIVESLITAGRILQQNEVSGIPMDQKDKDLLENLKSEAGREKISKKKAELLINIGRVSALGPGIFTYNPS